MASHRTTSRLPPGIGKSPRPPVLPSISSHFNMIEPVKPPARGETGKPRPRTVLPPPRSAPRKSPPASKASAAPPPRAAERQASAPGQATPAILIIDDDVAIRDLLRRVVSRNGWHAETASDGGQGIEMIGSAAPPGYAVVLLDLMMPNINGFEVIEHFKTHNPAMLRRIVVVTASPRVDRARIYSELIGGLIEKPFDITELVSYLQPIVDGLDSPGRT
jgi:CheY-like chemotaxis protein